MRATIVPLLGLALAIGPAATAQADRMQAVPYRCDDGRDMIVSFADGRAELTMSLSLEAQPSGSGFTYGGQAGVLRGKGDEIMWENGASGPVTCAAVPGGAALVGGTWELTRVNDVEAEMPARHTLTFAADGTALLRADCNRGRGSWKATQSTEAAGALALGPFAVTRMACPDDPFPAMAADLSDVQGYRVEGGALHLDAGSGAIYVFRAAAP